MLTFKAKTLAAKSKSRRLNPHLNKTWRCAPGKNSSFLASKVNEAVVTNYTCYNKRVKKSL